MMKFKRYETVEVRNEDSDKWEIRSYMFTTEGALTHLTLPEGHKNVRESGIRFEGWKQIQAIPTNQVITLDGYEITIKKLWKSL